MTTFEALARYYEARNAMKAAYDALGVAGRMHARRGSKAYRTMAAFTVYKMQRKVSIDVMGLTPDEARSLPGDVFALHMDRHRHLDSVAVREVRR